jgi:alpha-tubulin suppressor-like RCC1 family protein
MIDQLIPAEIQSFTGQGMDDICVSFGSRHYLAKNNRTIWGWGYNSEGTLGLGDYSDRVSPTIIPSLDAAAIRLFFCGWTVSLVVMHDYTV